MSTLCNNRFVLNRTYTAVAPYLGFEIYVKRMGTVAVLSYYKTLQNSLSGPAASNPQFSPTLVTASALQ